MEPTLSYSMKVTPKKEETSASTSTVSTNQISKNATPRKDELFKSTISTITNTTVTQKNISPRKDEVFKSSTTTATNTTTFTQKVITPRKDLSSTNSLKPASPKTDDFINITNKVITKSTILTQKYESSVTSGSTSGSGSKTITPRKAEVPAVAISSSNTVITNKKIQSPTNATNTTIKSNSETPSSTVPLTPTHVQSELVSTVNETTPSSIKLNETTTIRSTVIEPSIAPVVSSGPIQSDKSEDSKQNIVNTNNTTSTTTTAAAAATTAAAAVTTTAAAATTTAAATIIHKLDIPSVDHNSPVKVKVAVIEQKVEQLTLGGSQHIPLPLPLGTSSNGNSPISSRSKYLNKSSIDSPRIMEIANQPLIQPLEETLVAMSSSETTTSETIENNSSKINDPFANLPPLPDPLSKKIPNPVPVLPPFPEVLGSSNLVSPGGEDDQVDTSRSDNYSIVDEEI